MIVKLEV